MNRQETGIIMDILTAAYPRFYAGKDAREMKNAMNLWAEMFRDYEAKVVAAAVKALIASDSEGWPPHPGAVLEKIRLLTGKEEMSPQEAWNIVAKAIRNGLYGSREEFDRLPPDLQKLVGSANQLREWAMMDSDTVHSVVASNFQRSYRQRAAQIREYEALPSDVKAMIGNVAERLALHD